MNDFDEQFKTNFNKMLEDIGSIKKTVDELLPIKDLMVNLSKKTDKIAEQVTEVKKENDQLKLQIDGTDQNTGNEEHTTSATSVEPGTSNQVKNKPYADQDQEISPPFLRSARGGRGGRGISYSSRQRTMNDYQLKSKKIAWSARASKTMPFN
ncbi:hypothetical protein U1Q18_049856 [Sarracenia purpurea var. burkii]